LLDVFFSAHDPTQLNRQGNDIGRQYRSAVFFANAEQKRLAEEKIAELERKRVHNKRIVTKLEPLTDFHPAELYHQDFARRNPWVPYIQGHAVPKAKEVRGKHPELLRKGK
jgi:methionine-S-sulfoxide reductase